MLYFKKDFGQFIYTQQPVLFILSNYFIFQPLALSDVYFFIVCLHLCDMFQKDLVLPTTVSLNSDRHKVGAWL